MHGRKATAHARYVWLLAFLYSPVETKLSPDELRQQEDQKILAELCARRDVATDSHTFCRSIADNPSPQGLACLTFAHVKLTVRETGTTHFAVPRFRSPVSAQFACITYLYLAM